MAVHYTYTVDRRGVFRESWSDGVALLRHCLYMWCVSRSTKRREYILPVLTDNMGSECWACLRRGQQFSRFCLYCRKEGKEL